MGWDGMGWDGIGSAIADYGLGMGWDGMGWEWDGNGNGNGMGWDGTVHCCIGPREWELGSRVG